MKVVLALSGGIDSSTLLGLLLEQGLVVYPVSFLYPSKHNRYENIAAIDVYTHFKRHFPDTLQPITHINLTYAFQSFKSDLLLSGGEIPEGHYEAENMKATVVPGRNTIFIAFLLGIAETVKAQFIALGVHAGDHTIYPDCRPDYINAMEKTILYGSDNQVTLIVPFLYNHKNKIVEIGMGLEVPVPYSLTRTCYKDQQASCGKCGSCVERLEAFEMNCLTDPIIYEE